MIEFLPFLIFIFALIGLVYSLLSPSVESWQHIDTVTAVPPHGDGWQLVSVVLVPSNKLDHPPVFHYFWKRRRPR